ncbi:MAG: hypothetical protein WAK10_06495 [Methanoregula sp.]
MRRFVTTSVNVSQLAPNIFIFLALPITPITSSPVAAADPVVIGGGMNTVDGAGGVASAVEAAPTAIPHAPQNFVVALIGDPQFLQVRLSGDAVGADTTAVPHKPQNFSVPLIGFPQDLHTGRETGGAGGGEPGA